MKIDTNPEQRKTPNILIRQTVNTHECTFCTNWMRGVRLRCAIFRIHTHCKALQHMFRSCSIVKARYIYVLHVFAISHSQQNNNKNTHRERQEPIKITNQLSQVYLERHKHGRRVCNAVKERERPALLCIGCVILSHRKIFLMQFVCSVCLGLEFVYDRRSRSFPDSYFRQLTQFTQVIIAGKCVEVREKKPSAVLQRHRTK